MEWGYRRQLNMEQTRLNAEGLAGAILEIGLRVGVIPFNVTSRPVLLAILLSFTHKELRSLFNELYLL